MSVGLATIAFGARRFASMRVCGLQHLLEDLPRLARGEGLF